MSEELKPCPFCGVEMNLQNGLTHYIKHEVWCFFGMDRRDRPEKEQVEAWNTRPGNKELTTLKEEIKGLEEKTQVGWFHPAETRLCSTDAKDNSRAEAYAGYIIPVYILPQQEKEVLE